MLEGITWKVYFMIVGVTAAIYYIFLFALYYKGDLRKLLKRNSQIDLEYDYDEHGNASFDGIDELEKTVEDIRHGILEKAGKEANKAELRVQISKRLANYDGLRQPAFRIALMNAVIQQAEMICGVNFSEEELEADWAKLPR